MLALGIPSERELLARISTEELNNWIAFYRLEPWGATKDDTRFGIMAQILTQKPWYEFFPGHNWENIPPAPVPPQMTDEEIEAQANAFVSAWNKAVAADEAR